LAGRDPSPALAEIRRCAADLRTRWESRAVVVTLDRDGALLETGLGPPLAVPVDAATGDVCGAGDAFAVGLTKAFARHQVTSEAVVSAVESARRFVDQGGAAAFGDVSASRTGAGMVISADGVSSETSRGGPDRVVAAGGCFDVLHIGHVQLLEHARRLGDRLVVLLNSDASVRALKGPPRPIVPAIERAEVLRALACVDEVRIFDERTTDAALRVLRPDVFVKGGDYGHGPIAEQAVLDEWGGQAVVVPYVAGRSTTELLQEARHHDTDATG
jgi:rfaE bifunctional protein nucleotidyltransferase chain/domain